MFRNNRILLVSDDIAWAMSTEGVLRVANCSFTRVSTCDEAIKCYQMSKSSAAPFDAIAANLVVSEQDLLMAHVESGELERLLLFHSPSNNKKSYAVKAGICHLYKHSSLLCALKTLLDVSPQKRAADDD